jgi:hypothetical protein
MKRSIARWAFCVEDGFMKILKALSLILLACSFQFSFAKGRGNKGVSSGGGGDQYTADFINFAENEVYPWLKKNGQRIQPPVDAENFRQKIQDLTEIIESRDVVYESCDESTNGRIVAACYNSVTDTFQLNRKLYPLDVKISPSKRLLVMHEIFRRMKIEGDKYEITRKLTLNTTNPQLTLTCMIRYYQEAGFTASSEKAVAIQHCEKYGADAEVQQCVVNLVKSANFVDPEEKALAIDSCEKTGGSDEFQKYILTLYEKAGFKTFLEKSLAVDSFLRH